MIREIYLRDLKDITDYILDVQRNEAIDRLRNSYYYHGIRNVKFHMQTSLSRNCKAQSQKLEPKILSNFTKYASIDDPSLADSVWRQMIVGQHHGLPTRLLDWTHSPLVALHFAESENDLDKLPEHDAVVWRIDARDVNRNLPEAYREALEAGGNTIFSLERLERVCKTIEQYDRDLGGNAFVMLEPPSVDPRIISQYSFFSVIPSGMENVEDFLRDHSDKTVKFIIDRSIRWDLRDMLDQFNISERIIYPGLDGLTRWIGRHFFVKK